MNEDYIPSQIILDYYSNPVNYGKLKKYDLTITGKNSDCVDIITFYLQLSKDKKTIQKISFEHSGCVISKAGGCITTELVINKKISEILSISPETLINNLGGVLKTRIKCAYLSINLLKKGLSDFLKKETFSKKFFL